MKFSLPLRFAVLFVLALASTAVGQNPSACFHVFGIEQETGDLYRVDLAGDFGLPTEPVLLASPPGELEVREPDALAYDPRFRRLYFAGSGEEGTSTLYGYDLTRDLFWTAGELFGQAAGAVFHDGGYHYIAEGTDDLRRVFLTDEGEVFAEASVADFGFEGGLRVEDLAAQDGILYGSTRSGDEGPSARFFSYDPARDEFRTLSTSSGTFLQLAFADDRGLITLFGASTHDGVFYEIDHLAWSEGATESSFTFPVLFSDLSRGPMC